MLAKRSLHLVLIILLIMPVLTACPKDGKSFKDMSAKEKSIWMMGIYNGQYADYEVQAARTDLDEAQKEVLRNKKKILTEVYPLIGVYSGYADSGIIPAVDLESLIVQNLEQLLSMF